MKKKYAILIFLAFLIQFSFLPMFSWKVQIPNLILIVTTIVGIRKSLLYNFWWFLVAGLIFELFSVDFFGFNLLLFSLVGVLVWFFRNIVLNKEYNIIIEILFWFLVKIVWDLIHGIELFLWDLFQQNNNGELITLSTNYFKEIIFFILSGILINIFYKKFFSDK